MYQKLICVLVRSFELSPVDITPHVGVISSASRAYIWRWAEAGRGPQLGQGRLK